MPFQWKGTKDERDMLLREESETFWKTSSCDREDYEIEHEKAVANLKEFDLQFPRIIAKINSECKRTLNLERKLLRKKK